MKVLAKLDNAKLALYGLSYWVYVEKLCYVVKILTVFVKFFSLSTSFLGQALSAQEILPSARV